MNINKSVNSNNKETKRNIIKSKTEKYTVLYILEKKKDSIKVCKTCSNSIGLIKLTIFPKINSGLIWRVQKPRVFFSKF